MPDESSLFYPRVWEQGQVHRWFGQTMSPEVVQLIRKYWVGAPILDNRPLWAIGLYLMHQEAECIGGLAYPWDFGLSADRDFLRMHRQRSTLPFQDYPQLWERLSIRKDVLSRSCVGTSVLGYELPPAGYTMTVFDQVEPTPTSGSSAYPRERSRSIRRAFRPRSSPPAPRPMPSSSSAPSLALSRPMEAKQELDHAGEDLVPSPSSPVWSGDEEDL